MQFVRGVEETDGEPHCGGERAQRLAELESRKGVICQGQTVILYARGHDRCVKLEPLQFVAPGSPCRTKLRNTPLRTDCVCSASADSITLQQRTVVQQQERPRTAHLWMAPHATRECVCKDG
eukprot:6203438-Pleurochrysis_carterae.AAC.3